MSIYSKIQAIQSQVKELVRKEENKFQKYSFFNELQVMHLLKPLLEKYKLAVFISDDSSQQLIHETPKNEGGQHCIKYLKKLEIIDTEKEENEKLVFNFWACGSNSDLSKAKGSSDTYSVKYALSKLFLIPVTDEIDPDYSNEENKNRDILDKKRNSERRLPFY